MKILLILAVAMAAVALPGCTVRGRSGGSVSITPDVHVHSDICGHYRHQGNWHHQANHRHGDGCGHVLVSGSWSIR